MRHLYDGRVNDTMTKMNAEKREEWSWRKKIVSDVVFLLRLEHRNMSQLLSVVERQLSFLQERGPMDHALMESILGYCLTYPDECHHPKEDLIYRRLAVRDPAAADAVGDLEAHHAKLAALTRAFADALAAAEDDEPGAQQRTEWLGRQFLAGYRDHIAMEEGVFFPRALAALSERDWEDIEFDVFDTRDPLFSEPTEVRFRKVRNQILAGSVVTAATALR